MDCVEELDREGNSPPEAPEEKKSNEKESCPWEKYKEMSVEEKRRHYKCGNNSVKLENIQSWPEYYNENMKKRKKNKANTNSTEQHTRMIPYNPGLNNKVSIWVGDITVLEIDAIVNAANKSLLGGGGVDGCIHRAAGNTLVQECRKLHANGCETGDAKLTSGNKLPAKFVIHTVGPIGEKKEALESCYETCLKLSRDMHNIRSLAFCCISTGIYGYPNKDAAEVALNTTRSWLENDECANAIDRVIFCLYLEKDITIYESLMLKYFPLKPTETKENQDHTTEASKLVKTEKQNPGFTSSSKKSKQEHFVEPSVQISQEQDHSKMEQKKSEKCKQQQREDTQQEVQDNK